MRIYRVTWIAVVCAALSWASASVAERFPDARLGCAVFNLVCIAVILWVVAHLGAKLL